MPISVYWEFAMDWNGLRSKLCTLQSIVLYIPQKQRIPTLLVYNLHDKYLGSFMISQEVPYSESDLMYVDSRLSPRQIKELLRFASSKYKGFSYGWLAVQCDWLRFNYTKKFF